MTSIKMGICEQCCIEQHWSDQATAIAREVRQQEFEKSAENLYDPKRVFGPHVDIQQLVDAKLDEFWRPHYSQCLVVIDDEDCQQLSLCKQHVQTLFQENDCASTVQHRPASDGL